MPGVATLTWFEEWGPRGVRAADGSPQPVADAIKALRDLEGGEALAAPSPDGLVWALGARSDDGDLLLVANLDRRAREVVVAVSGREAVVTLGASAFGRLSL